MRSIDQRELLLQNPGIVSKPKDRSGIIKNITTIAALIAGQAIGCTTPVQKFHNFSQLQIPLEQADTSKWESISLPPYPVMYERLHKALGPQFLESINRHRKNRNTYLTLLQTEKEKAKIDISGLEHLKAIVDPSVLEDFFRAYLAYMPKPWLNPASLQQISIGEVTVYLNDYPGFEDLEKKEKAIAMYQPGLRLITLDNEDLQSSLEVFINRIVTILSHELAHAGDYDSSGKLEDKDFLALMYAVYLAVSDDGRPKFSESERAQYSTKDDMSQQQNDMRPQNVAEHRQKVLRFKMKEYFADLIAAAFNQHAQNEREWEEKVMEALQKNSASPKSARFNIELVKNYMKLVDPTYVPWDSYNKRTKLLAKLTHRIARPFYSKVVQEIVRDPDLRNFLEFLLAKKQKDLGQNTLKRWKFFASQTDTDAKTDNKYAGFEKQFCGFPDEREQAFCQAWVIELKKIAKVQLEFWNMPVNEDRITHLDSRKDLEKLMELFELIPPERQEVMKLQLLTESQKFMLQEFIEKPPAKKPLQPQPQPRPTDEDDKNIDPSPYIAFSF